MNPLLLQAGLDSLGSVELRNALSAKFEIELPATSVFDYPTVAALSGFIARQLAAAPATHASEAADDAAAWLSDDSSGACSDDELAVGGWLPGGASSAQFVDLTTDLVGLGCIYPGASGDSGAASSAAGESRVRGCGPAGSSCLHLKIQS